MIENYIARTIDCECGKSHSSNVETIVINNGVIENELVDFLKKNGYKRLTVVCDNKSYAVAGETVCKALDKNGITYKVHKFREEAVAPNEYSVGNLIMGLDTECDIILAVGSGTINDLCRYVSAVVGKEFCTVGTAPSMDGYISGGSALIYNNLKLTFETHTPKAVFFDPDMLGNAPRDMIASGVGDLLGKVNCLTDWRLAKIILGEWHCDFISGIVEAAIEKVCDARDGIAAGDGEACATLLEALLLSGVGMDFAGNSRPASGSEHHMSHFWEMRYLLEGREPVFHGTKVGIGTVIALKAYEYVAKLNPDFDKISGISRVSFEEWEKSVKEAFLDASPEIIELEKKNGKNDVSKLEKRLVSIKENWAEIKKLAGSVMKSAEVADFLKQLDAPTRPNEIGVEKEMARQAIMYAKEIRDRYTVLQLLWDLGELENFADMVINEYYG